MQDMTEVPFEIGDSMQTLRRRDITSINVEYSEPAAELFAKEESKRDIELKAADFFYHEDAFNMLS